jgi:PAS domain-containing protein
MSQKDIEVILTRQLASHLAMPIFIVDPAGTLIFYNEPAETILGLRFEETGEMSANEWAKAYRPMDEDGELLPPESLPLLVTVAKRRPAHGRLWIRGLDNVFRHIEVSSFPLLGQRDRLLGAVAVFWEVTE